MWEGPPGPDRGGPGRDRALLRPRLMIRRGASEGPPKLPKGRRGKVPPTASRRVEHEHEYDDEYDVEESKGKEPGMPAKSIVMFSQPG